MLTGGIDAGGTATKCLIIDDKGRILAEARTGSANYLSVGLEKAVKEIKEALTLAVERVGINDVDLLGLGLAGAGRGGDLVKLRKALLPLPQAKKTYLTDDGEIALYGAHQGEPGLIVIAGTGSIIYGKGQDDRVYRAGGWGPILGDEGSGFWFGLEALKALIAAREGRGPETILTRAILKELGFETLEELVSFIYQPVLPRQRVASLTPLLIEAMKKGDQVSTGIIEKGFEHLALAVNNLIAQLGLGRVKIAVAGGVFNSQELYQLMAEKVVEYTGTQLQRPAYSPVYGACLFAIQKAGFNIPPKKA